MTAKKRIYEILETAAAEDRVSRFFDFFIIILIALNVIAVILETVKSISSNFKEVFHLFEIFSVIIFSIEYLLRIWSCPLNPKYKHSIKGRIRFALTPLAIVDLLAILPFYIPMILPLDLRFMRALRLIRLFRLFKLGRYSDAMKLIYCVIKNKKEELLTTLFIVFLLLILSSSLLYYCEYETQPNVFSSIPAAMWWGIATLTTVGYGDLYPITPLGKVLGAIICLLGIGLFAMPTGIISAGFVEAVKKRKTNNICPNCGSGLNSQ